MPISLTFLNAGRIPGLMKTKADPLPVADTIPR